MANEDGTVWVTYNGELYNEPELRAASSRPRGTLPDRLRHREPGPSLRGGRGPTSSAGSTGCSPWRSGTARGAAASWHATGWGRSRSSTPRRPAAAWSSAPSPRRCCAHPEVGRRLDPAGLARYLFYEYIPAPHSIWAGMRKLPRGHVLVWERGRIRPSRATGNRRPWRRTAERAVRGGRRAGSGTTSATRWRGHRRSDVPLGRVPLGRRRLVERRRGALRARAGAERADVLDRLRGPELRRERARPRGRRVTSAPTTTSGRSRSRPVYELLPEVAAWLDEPFGDASILPTHLLSRFARSEVTVALGGDGADELLAGYPTFAAERAAGLYPPPARGRHGPWPRPRSAGCRSITAISASTSSSSSSSAAPPSPCRWRTSAGSGSFSGPEIARLLLRDGAAGVDVEAEHLALAAALAPGADPLTRSLALYQETYLPEDILTKVDRASMACGLEVRAPFLDAELVDAMQRLPAGYKYGRGQTKRLLKRAAAGRLPASILSRPKKGSASRSLAGSAAALAPLLDRLLEPRAAGPPGLVPPRRGRPADRRTPIGRPRPPQAALDPADVPALVRRLAGVITHDVTVRPSRGSGQPSAAGSDPVRSPGMRILVVSDIHANWPALAAIDEPHDVCLCLGDLVDYGPDPVDVRALGDGPRHVRDPGQSRSRRRPGNSRSPATSASAT